MYWQPGDAGHQDGLRDEYFKKRKAKCPTQVLLEFLLEAQKHILVQEIVESRRNLNKSESDSPKNLSIRSFGWESLAHP